MSPEHTSPKEPKATEGLRQRAEEALATSTSSPGDSPLQDVTAAMHELEVHQLELQMQNEELQRAHAELAHSRDDFAELYDFAPIGYMTLSNEATIVQANLTLCEMLGVARGDLLGSRFTRYVAPEAQDTLYLHHRALAIAPRHACELLLRSANGAWLSVQMQSVRVNDATKGFCGIRSALADISARKQVEEELRKSEQRYRALFENNLTGNFLASTAGEILLCNDAFASIFGCSGSVALSGLNLTEFYCTLDHWMGLLGQLGQRKGPMNQMRVVQRRNDDLTLIESMMGVFDHRGKLVSVQGYVFDDTARARADSEILRLNDELAQRVSQLEEQRARLQAIVDTAAEGIITIDEAGTIESINAAALKMFGYREQEVAGRNVSLLMPSPEHEAHDVYIRRYLETREARLIGTARVVSGLHKSGELVPVELALNEIALNGEHMFVGLIRDLSTQQRLERQLRERLEDAAQLHRLRTADELAGLLAHRLNQPLAAVLSFAEGAAARLRRNQSDSTQIATALAEIIEQAHRAANIIRDLRRFLSREGSERVKDDVNAIVRRALNLIGQMVRDADIELHFDLTEGLPWISLHASQIEQVLLILVDNAIDAILTPSSDQEVPRKPIGIIRVSTAFDQDAASVVVTVCDSGPGFDDALASRVFDPLYTTKMNGIGLGLSIARSIVEAHGGRIWAEATQGGLFHFALPAAK